MRRTRRRNSAPPKGDERFLTWFIRLSSCMCLLSAFSLWAIYATARYNEDLTSDPRFLLSLVSLFSFGASTVTFLHLHNSEATRPVIRKLVFDYVVVLLCFYLFAYSYDQLKKAL